MANHSGIASRNESESRLRRRQGVACVFVFISQFTALAGRLIDPHSGIRVRAIRQTVIRTIRMLDNPHWARPIQDVRRAKRGVSVAEDQRMSGSHPSVREDCSFSSWPTIGRDRDAAISRWQDFSMPLRR